MARKAGREKQGRQADGKEDRQEARKTGSRQGRQKEGDKKDGQEARKQDGRQDRRQGGHKKVRNHNTWNKIKTEDTAAIRRYGITTHGTESRQETRWKMTRRPDRGKETKTEGKEPRQILTELDTGN